MFLQKTVLDYKIQDLEWLSERERERERRGEEGGKRKESEEREEEKRKGKASALREWMWLRSSLSFLQLQKPCVYPLTQ
jgi:hypothetical protein